jgi:hypothetical protein
MDVVAALLADYSSLLRHPCARRSLFAPPLARLPLAALRSNTTD